MRLIYYRGKQMTNHDIANLYKLEALQSKSNGVIKATCPKLSIEKYNAAIQPSLFMQEPNGTVLNNPRILKGIKIC